MDKNLNQTILGVWNLNYPCFLKMRKYFFNEQATHYLQYLQAFEPLGSCTASLQSSTALNDPEGRGLEELMQQQQTPEAFTPGDWPFRSWMEGRKNIREVFWQFKVSLLYFVSRFLNPFTNTCLDSQILHPNG